MQRPIGIALLVLGVLPVVLVAAGWFVWKGHMYLRYILWCREGLGWPSRDSHDLSGGRALPSRGKSANELGERRTFQDLSLRGLAGRMSASGQSRHFDREPARSGPPRSTNIGRPPGPLGWCSKAVALTTDARAERERRFIAAAPVAYRQGC
jgi:hypothetical protein